MVVFLIFTYLYELFNLFRLLFSHVVPYLEFVITNCLKIKVAYHVIYLQLAVVLLLLIPVIHFVALSPIPGL